MTVHIHNQSPTASTALPGLHLPWEIKTAQTNNALVHNENGAGNWDTLRSLHMHTVLGGRKRQPMPGHSRLARNLQPAAPYCSDEGNDWIQ